MQGACKTMENIISQLDRSKSEHNHRLSNHSPVLNNEFQFGGLTVESFSTDHSDQSRFGSLHLPSEVSFSNKSHNGGLDSSWPVSASIQDQQSLCDSNVPNDRVLVPPKETLAMETRLVEPEQKLSAFSCKVERTPLHSVASNGRSDDTVGNVLPGMPINLDQDISCKTIPSDSERREDLQNETNCIRDSEQQFKDLLSALRIKNNELSARVRQADNTVALLKRQIQLNTQPDGSSSPGLNPDLIIALANEIEMLNSELDGYRRQQKLANGGNGASHMGDDEQPNNQAKLHISRRSCIPVRSGFAQHPEGTSLECTGGTQAKQLDDNLEQCDRAGEKLSSFKNTEVLLSPITSLLPQQDTQDFQAILTGVGDISSIPVESFSSAAAMHSVSVQPLLDLSNFECGLNVSAVCQTPFNTLTATNRQAFRELQAEVERLRRQLELTELENSRLQEMSRRNSMALSFLGTANTKPSDGQKEFNNEMHPLALPNVETDEVTLSAGFLKNLVEAHKYDHNALQRRLADSHETSRLLRARMEELLGFLEEMLVVTPPQKHAAERRAHVSACLNETRSLLADLSVNIGDQSDAFMEYASQHELDLSCLTDLDSSVAKIGLRQEDFCHKSASHASCKPQEQVPAEITRLQLELDELSRLRDSLQSLVDDLTNKLTRTEKELTATCSKNSELMAELENLKRIVSEHENERSVDLQKLKLVESSFQETESKLKETTETLCKVRAKNDDLQRVKREMENVLVEQEKNVTEYEERLRQLTKEGIEERNVLHKTLADYSGTITALKREREEQLLRINALENELEWMKDQMKSEKSEKISRDTDGIDARDTLIQQLKALVRENKTTAERLREELQTMNEEVNDRNKIIARLRQSCQELSIRCKELEIALYTSATPVDYSPNHRYSSADISDLSRCRMSESGFTGSPVDNSYASVCGSIPISLADESSVERARYSAEENAGHQVTIDFNTWCQQQGIRTQTAGVPAQSAAGLTTSDESHSLNGINNTQSTTFCDFVQIDGNSTVSESRTPAYRQIPHIRRLQFLACVEIAKILKAASEACSKIQIDATSSSPVLGQGDEDSSVSVQQLMTQLEALSRNNKALQQQLGGSQHFTSDNGAKQIRGASELASSEKSAEANCDDDVSKSLSALALPTLDVSKHPVIGYELELSSIRQRLEEATAVNHALRLELQLGGHISREDNKENCGGNGDIEARPLDLESILAEIRNLRLQLERSVASNDLLHQKLDRFNADSRCNADPDCRENDGLSKTASADVLKPADGSGNDTDGLQLAVVTQSSFELLKAETEKISGILAKLHKSVDTVSISVVTRDSDVNDSLCQLVMQLMQAQHEQQKFLATFSSLSAPLDRGKASAVLRAENVSLKQQLAELKQRYSRLKQAMKAARERLDANSQKKEEVLSSRRGWKNDEAIIEQINKTRQVLAQSSRNLESYHSASAVDRLNET